MSDLSQLVKAYDVRGVVPDQLNETVARALGTAFVEMLRESGDDADRIVIAHDMRESGPGLAAAFAAGANSAGAAVVTQARPGGRKLPPGRQGRAGSTI